MGHGPRGGRGDPHRVQGDRLMLEERTVACPYCGESFDAFIDPSETGTSYIQDCTVCCRPIRFHLAEIGHGELSVEVTAEDG